MVVEQDALLMRQLVIVAEDVVLDLDEVGIFQLQG